MCNLEPCPLDSPTIACLPTLARTHLYLRAPLVGRPSARIYPRAAWTELAAAGAIVPRPSGPTPGGRELTPRDGHLEM
eukprot:15456353-Alexandrium_andersonii.AAC.1